MTTLDRGFRLFAPYAPPSPASLMASRITPRQRQLVDLLIEKRSIAAAARELGMSIHTARHHVRDIALRVPNPHGLPAHRLILSYFEQLPGSL